MNRTFKVLPAFFTLSLKLASVFALLFFLCRLLFVWFNMPGHNQEAFSTYLSAFFIGLRFDLLVSSYVLMIPALILFVHQAFSKENKIILGIVKLYLFVMSLWVFFIACADVPYYSQFGSHVNKSVMVWKLTPGYTLKLVFSSFYYWGFFLVFLALSVLYFIVVRRLFLKYKEQLMQQKVSFLSQAFFLLLLASLIFVFARGRLSFKSTMHEGMSIVSQNAFVNQIGMNPNFSLFKSLSRKEESTDYLKNIKNDLGICRQFFDQNYFPENGVLDAPITSTSPVDSIKKLNVIVVLMESLSMSKMGYYRHKNLCPYLSELIKESVFFDRFFSSGIHTFNGLFSTTSGFPCIYDKQELRQYTRRSFTTLATLLKPFGYHTYFCTTHDAVFDNMAGFFKLNGYDNLISEDDFSVTESIGVTGVPDHLLYKKLIERVNTEEEGQPFVACLMSGTDHGPWQIPDNIDFKPTGAIPQENACLYADWAVKQFIEEAKKQSWYRNTVFVFLGDHGQIIWDPYDMAITYHHTPLIIHCPQELKPEVNHHLGYQPDIVNTVASVLNVNYRNFSFGENLFKKDRPFIFFSADDKLGFVTRDDLFFFHTLTDNQKKLVRYKNLNQKNLYPYYKKRMDSLYSVMRSLYNSAHYYLSQNYDNTAP